MEMLIANILASQLLVLSKAKILAARRETSISGLLAQEIESMVGEGEAYERSERQATAFSIAEQWKK